ncbi:MAG TPA: uracil-DNA glycosylase, partial [Sulfitobacter sp.]|nr:uracil-DNA glycosylase [Sulfitobacter sp.]
MHRVSLPPIGTAKAWREAARGFLAAGIPPEQILWGDHAAVPNLFGGEA